MNHFDQTLQQHGLQLHRTHTRVLQINVGKKCNQTCIHCHVNAGPARTEIMSRETMQRILDWLAPTDIETVDITGGAPELNPHFRFFVEQLRTRSTPVHIIDRCNLTILQEPGQEDLAEFLAQHEIEIMASMPCYEAANVNEQRGDGVFERSIRGLQQLNELGYGTNPRLPRNLVYSPNGAFLPPPQATLEATYKQQLREHFGIVFNNLYTITNMPISRFANFLRLAGKLEEYQELLQASFSPAAVENLMCRNTLSIGWRGEVYDCDFNQMLNMSWNDVEGRTGVLRAPLYLWDIAPGQVEQRPILTANHCFGCTAGAGSSCGGALAE